MLLDHGACRAPALYFAAQGGQTPLVEWLCEQFPGILSAPIPWTEPRVGVAALYAAVKILNRPTILALIAAGVSLNESHFMGKGLVHAARANLGHAAAELLISCGAADETIEF